MPSPCRGVGDLAMHRLGRVSVQPALGAKASTKRQQTVGESTCKRVGSRPLWALKRNRILYRLWVDRKDSVNGWYWKACPHGGPREQLTFFFFWENSWPWARWILNKVNKQGVKLGHHFFFCTCSRRAWKTNCMHALAWGTQTEC